MPRGTHGSFWDPPEMGKMCGLNSPFWSDFSVSLTISELLGIRNTNLICRIIDCQGTCDLCYYCVQWLWFQTWFDCQEVPSLARHGQFEERWSSSFKSISEVKGYSHWNYKGLFPSTLVTLALSGPEETLILVWWFLGGSYTGVAMLKRLLYWCGEAWKEVVSFMFISVILWSGIYSESFPGTQVTRMFPPAV